MAGRFGDDPAVFPAAIGDGAFNALDGDRRLDDPQHAGAFAGSGANAAGEFGEVVGLVQPVQRLVPFAAEDQVVPLGDQVVDGTAGGRAGQHLAGVAERRAAIHAARALRPQLRFVERQVKLVPVANALERRQFRRQLAVNSRNPVGLPIV